MGALGWSPSSFWGATPADLTATVAGWRRAHGIRENATPDMTPAEMLEAYEEMLRGE